MTAAVQHDELHAPRTRRLRAVAANGATSMNPATLLRLWSAFEQYGHRKQVHILRIGADAGTWPSTIYRAVELGYLVRTKPAWFRTTQLLRDEVRRAHKIRRINGLT